MRKDLVPIDGKKMSAILKKRGLTKAEVGRDIGRSSAYITSAIHDGHFTKAGAVAIEKTFGIKPSDYAPDPKPKKEEPKPEAEQKTDGRLLSGIIFQIDDNAIIGHLYKDGRELGRGFAYLRRDVEDETLRFAQAASYVAHSIYKDAQHRAEMDGRPFVYHAMK